MDALSWPDHGQDSMIICIARSSAKMTSSVPVPWRGRIEQAICPVLVLGLVLLGGPFAYTALAAILAVAIYPNIVDGGKSGRWMWLRHAIVHWGQRWHRSCGRAYEKEGPESWVSEYQYCIRSRFVACYSGRRWRSPENDSIPVRTTTSAYVWRLCQYLSARVFRASVV